MEGDTAMQRLSANLTERLQTVDPLVIRRTPDEIGVLMRTDGTRERVPLTPFVAWADLREYRVALEESLFSTSSISYPRDSISRVERDRARGWLDRLMPSSRTGAASAKEEMDYAALAQIAFLAERDSLAQKLFDTRIRQIANRPALLAMSLYVAVATFSNPLQDSTRLVRNAAVARQYLTTLVKIPVTGYRTQLDRERIMMAQFRAEDTLIVAHLAIGDTVGVNALCRSLLGFADSYLNRVDPISAALDHMVTLGAYTEAGRTQARAFWPAVRTAVRRTSPRLLDGFEQMIARAESRWRLLGTPGPVIAAHLWLNTPDSIYTSTPRQRALRDGHFHVVCISSNLTGEKVSRLDRVRRRYHDSVGTLLVVSRYGYAGVNRIGGREGAARMATFYEQLLHAKIPIAIWAGEWKEIAGTDRVELDRGPNDPDLVGDENCLVIDPVGRIAAILPFASRNAEQKLWRELDRLMHGATPPTFVASQ